MYADDLMLFSHSAQELQKMLQDISDASKRVGLVIHADKTKIMRNEFADNITKIKIDDKEISNTNKYSYLGQIITNDHDQTLELNRRIGLGWSTFGKYRNILTNRKINMDIKKRIFNEFILPTMIYGSQTWSLSNTKLETLSITQRKMERAFLGITLLDKKTNEWIRSQTKIHDVKDAVKENLHRWAGHVARFSDNRWTIRLSQWYPRGNTRRRGRPKTRWRDPLSKFHGVNWMAVAGDRKSWKMLREGFLQQERE